MILLYDGVCGLCHRLVQFILERDRRGTFRFAPLQGSFARTLLLRHGRDPDDLDTVYVVVDHDLASEHLLSRGRAVLAALRALGGVWRLAGLLGFLPTALLDAGYDLIARHRYRWFGKHAACTLPAPHLKDRFIDE